MLPFFFRAEMCGFRYWPGYNQGASKTGSTLLTITDMAISKATCVICISTEISENNVKCKVKCKVIPIFN
jgi:hypothetical protein